MKYISAVIIAALMVVVSAENVSAHEKEGSHSVGNKVIELRTLKNLKKERIEVVYLFDEEIGHGGLNLICMDSVTPYEFLKRTHRAGIRENTLVDTVEIWVAEEDMDTYINKYMDAKVKVKNVREGGIIVLDMGGMSMGAAAGSIMDITPEVYCHAMCLGEMDPFVQKYGERNLVIEE